MRRLLITVVMLAVMATAAMAAPQSGKVIKIQNKEVSLVLGAKPAIWVKKGGPVRFLGARAMVVSIASDTLVLSTPNAAKTKVGETVTIDKPRASGAGC